MARPLRIEFAGALYHVTARGNAQANIYANDEDRTRDENMAQTYLSGHYTLDQVGRHFNVSYATVSRAVKQAEGRD